MKKVAFINILLPQYRTDFFHLLKEVLLKYDIELEVIYGKSNDVNALKNDEVDIEWARYIPNKTFKIGKTELIFQPCLKDMKDKDLVIIENANKLLINYYLIAVRKFSKYKLAYWGHGRNLQEDQNSWRNKFKYLFLDKCDWWFGYTNTTKNILTSRNFPLNRITVVQNTIDTRGIRKYYSEITESETAELRNELDIYNGTVALYCGGMYPEKNFDFILRTCYLVKQEIPDFHMIFIGSGIEAAKIIKASESNAWIHYVGSKFGKDRIKYFKISHIQLMPYYVGLGLVDSFALETPLITTSNPFHGPEIDYLENGINGFMTKDNINDYSSKVIDVLKNKSYLDLVKGCKLSAERITLEVMVENFKDGVLLCLNTLKK
ncbi:MAG: glycosyltransferase family 4 protein [Bacteroidota bacterium]|nr:glycosyltransferase family 4 protein [Bacteroidota bacterium]